VNLGLQCYQNTAPLDESRGICKEGGTALLYLLKGRTLEEAYVLNLPFSQLALEEYVAYSSDTRKLKEYAERTLPGLPSPSKKSSHAFQTLPTLCAWRDNVMPIYVWP